MVATAPGEKLLIGRRLVRSWTPPYDIKLVFLYRNLHLFLRKSTKTSATRAALLTPICTKSFVGWGFASDPTEGVYSAPPADPPAVFRGPTSKGRAGEGKREEVDRRRGDGNEGVRRLA